MRFKAEVEASIRSSTTFDELKTAMLEMLDTIQDDEFTEYKEHELLSERVSNIETCLDRSTINTEVLRI